MIYKCLGLMSGTSLDGVDGAVCVTDGSKIIDFQKNRWPPGNFFLKVKLVKNKTKKKVGLK